MLAQSLVEYGSLSGIVQTVQHARYLVEAWLGALSSRDWAVAGTVVLIGLALRTLRHPR
jgi:hypothetical protein